jgi:hypothetical protein
MLDIGPRAAELEFFGGLGIARNQVRGEIASGFDGGNKKAALRRLLQALSMPS